MKTPAGPAPSELFPGMPDAASFDDFAKVHRRETGFALAAAAGVPG